MRRELLDDFLAKIKKMRPFLGAERERSLAGLVYKFRWPREQKKLTAALDEIGEILQFQYLVAGAQVQQPEYIDLPSVSVMPLSDR